VDKLLIKASAREGRTTARTCTCHFQDTTNEAAGRIYPESQVRAEAQPLSQPRASHHPLQMYPLVRDLAADGIPVAVTCRVLGFSKQAFYAWRANPVTDRDWSDAHLLNAAIDIHYDDPEFGYRFITDELAAAGVLASRNRVNRLCTQQRLWSVHARQTRTESPARTAGPRRPGRSPVPGATPEPVAAHRHHPNTPPPRESCTCAR